MNHYLTIANIRYHLSGDVNPEAFDESFIPFLDTDDSFDAECDIFHAGANAELSLLTAQNDEPWSFRMVAGECDVQRRDIHGQVIWRLTASLDFNSMRVAWNPNLFPRHYTTYEKAWQKGLGLTFAVLKLRELGGLVFHGSASVLNGEGVLCVGVSGQGKSTLSGLLDAAGARVLTDEHPVLRQSDKADSGFLIHGSPWPSSARFFYNNSAPLKRIYFLEQGSENIITPLAKNEAFQRMLKVAIIPWQEPQLFDPCLETIETLLTNVPAAVLSFVPHQSVVDAIRQDLAGEEV